MNTEFIIKKFEEILPNDFYVKTIEDIFLKGFLENGSTLKGIFLGSIDDLLTTNIIASINFKEIENILYPKEDKFSITTINININKHLFNHKVGEGILDQLPISLNSEAELDKVCQLIQQYIQQEALPFFNYWRDIRDFLPFLETEDISYLSDIFSGDALFKKIIIWKLCSHPKFNEFTEKKTSQLEKRLAEIPNDSSFKKNYVKYIKILKTLEKIDPLHLWKDSYLIQKPYVR